MAGYGTNLTTLATGDGGDAGTWTELTAFSAGGTPALDGENYIQGVNCYSQTTGNKSGLVFSIVYDNGAAITWTSGWVVLMWFYYAVGPNLATYANGGSRAAVTSDLTNGYAYYVGGSDYGRNPYGGWMNIVVDPSITSGTGVVTLGAGNGGSYRYFGSILNTLANITKGTPHAVDAIRYGRGDLWCTGATATFDEMATYNDYNDVTNGYNRFGILSFQGGTYLWKGLLSLGTTGASVTFDDSNRFIVLDDTPHVYRSFNKIEINDVTSTVNWNSITIQAINETGTSRGQFLMVDNATVSLESCTFIGMDTFNFQSGATLNNTTWRRCNEVYQSGATFSNCTFANSTVGSSGVTLYVDDISKVTNCDFTSNGTGHAIEGFSTAGSYDLVGITFTNYFSGTTGNTGNEAIYVTATSGTVTLNISGGGTSSFSVRSAGATVVIVAGAVTVSATVTDTGGNNVTGARVFIYAFTGGTSYLPYRDIVTISNSGTLATVTHTAHNLITNDKVSISGSDVQANNGVHTITVVDVNTYTYTMDTTPGASPTATTYSTFVALEGLTVDGFLSTSRVYTANQVVRGWVRRGTATPLYKQSSISGTIDSDNGLPVSITLVSDE